MLRERILGILMLTLVTYMGLTQIVKMWLLRKQWI